MNTRTSSVHSDASDYLNATAVFGELKRTIVSNDFKGGRISNVFGEINLDFTYADITGVVVLDISQTFGEIKLAVPATWRVEIDLSQFFADIRDKRQDLMQAKDTDKVLLITGNSVFAEIKIANSI